MFYTSLFVSLFIQQQNTQSEEACNACISYSSTVVGAAVVLSGCQTTGNNLGGVEYDKAALGTFDQRSSWLRYF